MIENYCVISGRVYQVPNDLGPEDAIDTGKVSPV